MWVGNLMHFDLVFSNTMHDEPEELQEEQMDPYISEMKQSRGIRELGPQPLWFRAMHATAEHLESNKSRKKAWYEYILDLISVLTARG